MRIFGRAMQSYNFTERTRKTLARARDEAERLHHEYVGTEHMLLALTADDDGVAVAALDSLGVDRASLRESVDRIVVRGKSDQPVGPDLPYTSRAKKVFDLAMAEARLMSHSYLGTEHLLLGLMAEGKGIASQVLADHGATLAALRDETLRLLGPARGDRSAQVVALPVTQTPPDLAPARDRARERLAWARLGRALDVTARLGAAPTLELEADGTLSVSVGPDLVVTVDFPPGVRLRRRDGGRGAGAPPAGPPTA
jgi:ATP-dependent Clp protease ATP-binding subunit ClpC